MSFYTERKEPLQVMKAARAAVRGSVERRMAEIGQYLDLVGQLYRAVEEDLVALDKFDKAIKRFEQPDA